MDVQEIDQQIEDQGKQIEQLYTAQDKATDEFLTHSTLFAQKWIGDYIDKYVTDDGASRTKQLEQSQIDHLKQDRDALVQEVPTHVAKMVNKDVSWPHRSEQKINLPPVLRLEHEPPVADPKAWVPPLIGLRQVLGHAAVLLSKYDYMTITPHFVGAEWMATKESPHPKFHAKLKLSDEVIKSFKAYKDLFIKWREAKAALRGLEGERVKAEARAKWK
jgi:hypothetical protein